VQGLLNLLDPTRLVDMLVRFAPRAGAAVLVFLVFWILLVITRSPLKHALRKVDFEDTLVRLLIDNVYRFVILGFGLFMAASQLGINIGAALAGVGVVGIAVGFAAQESVANTIAGFLIFWDKPFKVGQFITTQGKYGEVVNVTMRTTRVKTLNNTYVIIPNKEIIGGVIVNHSLYGETRVETPIGIAYKEDIRDARRVLLKAMTDVPDVMDDPSPTVVAVELGDSSVNLLLRVWIRDAAQEKAVFFEALEAGKLALDEAGIEIPFPHLQLFVDEFKEPVWKGLRELPLIAEGRTRPQG
jgi:small conductance mechanosensitive channel